MAFTTESIDTPIPSVQNTSARDLPVKEFVSYDRSTVAPKPENAGEMPNVKQAENTEGAQTEPEEEKSVQLSPKVSAIARREQAQRQREEALKQREKELEAKLADAERFAQLKAKLANKDYSAAEELGLKYDEYTEHLVSQEQKKNPEAERIAKLEAELEQFKKSQEEKIVEEYEANQALWKQEISRVVGADDELSTFEKRAKENGLLEDGKSFGDLILQHINESFEEDDIRLTAEEAAREIKQALVENAKKFSSLLGNVTFEAPAKRLGAPPPQPKSITQNMTVSSQKPVKKPFHLMSESEQIAEAYRRVQEAKMQR